MADGFSPHGGEPGAPWPDDDHLLAARLASEAGVLLVELRARLNLAGTHAWQVMDDGDAAAHHFLVKALQAARPDDAILSEEGRDSSNRLSANRVWILDPLDGTNEFGEWDRPDWAVPVALVLDGSPHAAAVALPAIGRTFATDPAPELPPPADRPPRIVTSRWRTPQGALLAARALGTVCHLTFVNDSNTSACLIVDADATTTGGSNYLNHITNDDAGFYGLTFTACQLGYVGRGFLSINASAYLPVFHEFTLLPANTYDSLIGGTDFLNAGLSASGVDAILDEVVEGTYTMRQYLRLMAAALYGKASGAVQPQLPSAIPEIAPTVSLQP